MSGGYDSDTERLINSKLIEEAEEIERKYNIDKKTAKKIIIEKVVFANIIALEKMAKWTRNMRKIQKEKAEDIYSLTKILKKNAKCNKRIVNEIEKKILELCVNGGE